jgi:aminoglycoside phosphotransferase (APT) family kinase protein
MRMADPAGTPGLRLQAVREWLDRAGIGLDCSAPLTATLFPGGRSNVTYLLTDAHAGAVILRRPPLGNVLPTAHDMAREHRVLTGLARAGFPAPAALALCEDPEVTGAPFLVMSYVPGRIVSTAADASVLSVQERREASRDLVATLGRLHAIDLAQAGLTDLGRPQGYLPRQLVRWSKQWELTRTRDLDTMDRLWVHLDRQFERIPDDLPTALVHGDFRLDNAILDSEQPRVRAVLDWEMSTLGDPLADLALALVYWTEAADRLRHRVPVAEHLTDAEGFLGRADVIEEYVRVSGRHTDHLDVCTALACFKLAVITESIHARTRSGQQLGAAAADLEAMGTATEALAEIGLAVVAKGTVAGLAS